MNTSSTSKERVQLIAQLRSMGRAAREASHILGLISSQQKKRALQKASEFLRLETSQILEANALDVETAKQEGQGEAFIDRLNLTEQRIASIAQSVEDIASLPDPVGSIISQWERPNGLKISRVRTPLGVIGVIFESRPNVTADAGALSFMAGNAVILRTGSGALRSAIAIHAAMIKGLIEEDCPEAAIQVVPFADREAVGQMLCGLDGTLDVIVPRGGKSLVERVHNEARIPVFAHLDGNNHVYVHEKADLEMAKTVLLNAKLRRTGICGATETLLIDKACVDTHLAPLILALLEEGCEVRGDEIVQKVDERVKKASIEDWSTEYLDKIIAAKIVENIEEAIAHIEHYGSHHTDAIITKDENAATKFLREVDSAIVLHNASTQFADGGEFGFGAEIGIATGRMHARGPVGVEQLTSFKYIVHGNGQIRPL